MKYFPLVLGSVLLIAACDKPVSTAAEPSPAATPASVPQASEETNVSSAPADSNRTERVHVSSAEIEAWLEKSKFPQPSSGKEARTLAVAINGSDNNPGTPEQPFATIQKALDAAQAGDRVLVHSGTYTETVSFPRSGQADKPIVLEGERGPDGQWQTILDPGVPLKGWTPAPEIGEGVFQLPSNGVDPYCLTAGGKQILRVHDRLMALPGTKRTADTAYTPILFGGIKDFEEAGINGFSFLSIPSEGLIGMVKEAEGHLPFWNGIEALYGVREGIIYLRFRDGRNPDTMVIRAAPATTALTIENQSHIVVRNLAIQGAEKSVLLSGGKAFGNVIEGNSLRNGLWRVVLTKGARQNLVRGNEITLRFFGSDDFGAWGGTHTEQQANRQSQVRMMLYRAFKHVSGTDASADIGVRITAAGPGNRIAGNHIYGGLKGLHCMSTPDLTVDGNVIHNMSSVGIVTLPDLWNARFHDNFYFDCNIILRIHQYNSPSHRSEYHYRNVFRQSPGEGTHIYVHYNDFGADFGPEQESPIGIYQNTFVGGNRGLVCGSQRREIGMTKTMVLNNIISTLHEPVSYLQAGGNTHIYQIFDYNWIGGARQPDGSLPAWFGSHNINALGRELWPSAQVGNFTPPEEVQGKGIDLSHEFTIEGNKYEPLPGMEPGYFSGVAPDLGAIQHR